MNPEELAAAIARLHPVAKAWLARQLQATAAMAAQRGGYAKPYANNSPWTAHDEQGLNWHGRAGFTHGLPVGGYERDIGNPADPDALRLKMAHRAAMPSSVVMDSLGQQAPGGPAIGGSPDMAARLAMMRQQQFALPQTQPRTSNPYAALMGPGANTNPWVGGAGPSVGAMSLGYGMQPQTGIGGGVAWPQTGIGGYGRPPSATVNPMKSLRRYG